MDIETSVFARFVPDIEKLKKYGFCEKDGFYCFEKEFFNNDFKAVISVSKTGKVNGTVYDLANGDEYLPLRIKHQEGSFVGNVRLKYEEILLNIRDACFIRNQFIYPQSNRITNLIFQKYNESPDFPWIDDQGYGVFRNPNNKKWYGLIMNIDYSKIDKTKHGEIEVINIKLDEKEIQELLKEDGFFPAWHMNKKTWITIILNETLNDKKIMQLINKSRDFTVKKLKK